MDPAAGWPSPAPWPSPPRSPPRRRWRGPWLNAALLLATVCTTLLAGFGLAAPAGTPLGLAEVARHGWPYSAALVGILGAHELGHYALARWHGVDATLPYFIPVPFGVGTFGAVMRMRSAPPSRAAVLDVGVAGPLAGFAVALPLLAWGLAHSTPVEVAGAAGGGFESPLAALLAWWRGQAPAAGDVQLMGDSLVTWGLQRLLWGELAPGHDLLIHPVGYAGWLGMLVTALNLVPIGQLDGGHLTYALLGRERAERASRLVSAGLLACGLVLSWNWLVWWLLTRYAVGMRHPPSPDERPLGPGRRALAVAGLLLFALTFVPVPFAF